jgi:hypothetical protein
VFFDAGVGCSALDEKHKSALLYGGASYHAASLYFHGKRLYAPDVAAFVVSNPPDAFKMNEATFPFRPYRASLSLRCHETVTLPLVVLVSAQ